MRAADRATASGHPSVTDGGVGFRRTVALVVGVLLVAVGSLGAVTAVRGPRVVDAELDPLALVERPNQRIRLHLDQPIDSTGSVVAKLSPATEVRTRVDARTITITTTAALSYGTTYTVTVPIRGRQRTDLTTVTSSFRTPDAQIYLLDRSADGGDDRVLRPRAGSERSDEIFRAPRIEEVAVARDQIAVTADQGADSGTLRIGPVGGELRTVADHAHVEQLHASSTGSFGYVITPLGRPDTDSASSVLQLFDPRLGTTVDVVGLDRRPVNPRDWAFVPGTTAVIVQEADLSVFLIDPTRRTPPRPLGTHVTLEGFVAGSATLLVEDADHRTAIDLVAGTSTPVALGALRPGDNLLGLVPVGTDRYAGQYLRQDGDGYRHLIGLIGSEPTTSEPTTSEPPRQLYAADPGSSILQVCASPNGQYLSVELAAAGATTDDHTVNPGFRGARTEVIDADDGRVVVRSAGFASSWCG